MENKLFEIRDAATFIPALAIRVSREDGYLMGRAGFGEPCIWLIHMTSQRCSYDPYEWGNRTMTVAHDYIEKHWHELDDSAVIDVQFILGETVVSKESERVSSL